MRIVALSATVLLFPAYGHGTPQRQTRSSQLVRPAARPAPGPDWTRAVFRYVAPRKWNLATWIATVALVPQLVTHNVDVSKWGLDAGKLTLYAAIANAAAEVTRVRRALKYRGRREETMAWVDAFMWETETAGAEPPQEVAEDWEDGARPPKISIESLMRQMQAFEWEGGDADLEVLRAAVAREYLRLVPQPGDAPPHVKAFFGGALQKTLTEQKALRTQSQWEPGSWQTLLPVEQMFLPPDRTDTARPLPNKPLNLLPAAVTAEQELLATLYLAGRPNDEELLWAAQDLGLLTGEDPKIEELVRHPEMLGWLREHMRSAVPRELARKAGPDADTSMFLEFPRWTTEDDAP